jgi:hypothetical protein
MRDSHARATLPASMVVLSRTFIPLSRVRAKRPSSRMGCDAHMLAMPASAFIDGSHKSHKSRLSGIFLHCPQVIMLARSLRHDARKNTNALAISFFRSVSKRHRWTRRLRFAVTCAVAGIESCFAAEYRHACPDASRRHAMVGSGLH